MSITKSINDSQAGWLEAFNAIADAGNNLLLMTDFENEFDKNEWAESYSKQKKKKPIIHEKKTCQKKA